MSGSHHADPKRIRAGLHHPVVDADGHWLEYAPIMREEFRKIAGEAAAEVLAGAPATR